MRGARAERINHVVWNKGAFDQKNLFECGRAFGKGYVSPCLAASND